MFERIFDELKNPKYYAKEIMSYKGMWNIQNRQLSDSIKVYEDSIIASSGRLNEGVISTFDLKGGMITFSTDVNANDLMKNKILNWIKQKLITAKQRKSVYRTIDMLADKYKVQAWTIGRFLRGRYKADDGTIFDENSISLEIIGVSINVLFNIATDLCNELHQECVLVKDYDTGDISLVDGSPMN